MPLVTNPAYSDYTSGHAAATSPFARCCAGPSVTTPRSCSRARRPQRTYATLTALEHDALNARIWGGLHFRDAMEDGYYLGHTTADEVMSAVH